MEAHAEQQRKRRFTVTRKLNAKRTSPRRAKIIELMIWVNQTSTSPTASDGQAAIKSICLCPKSQWLWRTIIFRRKC
jgi:hypothetical protein